MNGFYLDNHSEYFEIDLNNPDEFPFALSFEWTTDLTVSTNDVTAEEMCDFLNENDRVGFERYLNDDDVIDYKFSVC